jgi:hypothetical protein
MDERLVVVYPKPIPVKHLKKKCVAFDRDNNVVPEDADVSSLESKVLAARPG